MLSLDLAAATADPEKLKPTEIFAPGPRETFTDARTTRDRLLVAGYENVRGVAGVPSSRRRSGRHGWVGQRQSPARTDASHRPDSAGDRTATRPSCFR
jgi:prolyl oligopeptidase PreP (S9A serine peptidase family)